VLETTPGVKRLPVEQAEALAAAIAASTQASARLSTPRVTSAALPRTARSYLRPSATCPLHPWRAPVSAA
jgi:hypothetical protein